jgi:hypothetical protein
MADAPPVVHIGENSPEQIAYRLMHDVANVEKRQLYSHGDQPADRKWILDTFAECLNAVKRPGRRVSV